MMCGHSEYACIPAYRVLLHVLAVPSTLIVHTGIFRSRIMLHTAPPSAVVNRWVYCWLHYVLQQLLWPMSERGCLLRPLSPPAKRPEPANNLPDLSCLALFCGRTKHEYFFIDHAQQLNKCIRFLSPVLLLSNQISHIHSRKTGVQALHRPSALDRGELPMPVHWREGGGENHRQDAALQRYAPCWWRWAVLLPYLVGAITEVAVEKHLGSTPLCKYICAGTVIMLLPLERAILLFISVASFRCVCPPPHIAEYIYNTTNRASKIPPRRDVIKQQ